MAERIYDLTRLGLDVAAVFADKDRGRGRIRREVGAPPRDEDARPGATVMSEGRMTEGEVGPFEAHLWVCAGRNVGQRFAIGVETTTLGRALNNDLVVEDERASQRHAQIAIEDGQHVIRDLRSTNGTYVNNQRVLEASLRDGDLIQIGETVFEYLGREERIGGTTKGTHSGAIPTQLRDGAQARLEEQRRVPDPAQGAFPGGHPPPAGAAPPHPGAVPGPYGGHAPPAGGYGPTSNGPGGYGPTSNGPGGPGPYGPPGGGFVPPGHPPGGAPGLPHPGAVVYPQPGAYYPPPYGGVYPGVYQGEATAEPEKSGPDLVGMVLHVRRVLGPLIPYWPMIVAFTFIGVMGGALNFRLNPPPKTAEFALLLNPQGASSVLGSGSETVTFFGNEVGSRFGSVAVVNRALERITGREPPDGLVDAVQRSIKFERVGNTINSNQYTGSFSWESSDFTLQYLDAHIAAFVEREISMGLSQLEADTEFFAAEMERSAQELEAAESAMARYKAQNPDALPDQARSNYSLLFRTKQELSTLETRKAAVEALLRERRRQRDSIPEYLTGGSYTDDNRYKQQIAELTGQLEQERAKGKGDAHPDVERIRKQIAYLEPLANNEDLTQKPTQYRLNPAREALKGQILADEAELKGLRQQIRKVQAKIEEQEKVIESLPSAEAGFVEVTQAYDAALKEHSIITKRFRDAELQLDYGRARARTQYVVTQKPRLVAKPVGKKRLKNLAIGGFLGAFLAGLVALVLVFRSGRLTLATVLGREIDLSPFFGPTGAEQEGLGRGGDQVPEQLPAPDRPSPSHPPAPLPLPATTSTERGGTDDDDEATLHGHPPADLGPPR